MSLSPLVVTCALIRRQDRLLLARRQDNGLWELPGGKVEPGEDLAQCLARELAEELAVQARVLRPLAWVSHGQGERVLELHCFECSLVSGPPQALEHRELRWVTFGEAAKMELCPADRQLWPHLAWSLIPRSDQ